jgi:hypothetical protein
MWVAIATAAAKVGGFFADLASTIMKYVAIWGAYLLGKSQAKKEQLEDAAEVKDEQLEVYSQPDAHRSTLLERMRRRRRKDN